MSSEYEIMTGTQPYAEDLGVDTERTKMRSSTETLIAAMRILARDIQSEDGVANSAISEAADRLAELTAALQYIVKHQEEVAGSMAKFSATWIMATRALN